MRTDGRDSRWIVTEHYAQGDSPELLPMSMGDAMDYLDCFLSSQRSDVPMGITIEVQLAGQRVSLGTIRHPWHVLGLDQPVPGVPRVLPPLADDTDGHQATLATLVTALDLAPDRNTRTMAYAALLGLGCGPGDVIAVKPDGEAQTLRGRYTELTLHRRQQW